jgi:hypothetical protein
VRTVRVEIAPVNDPPAVTLDPAGPVDEGAAPVTLTAHGVDVEASDGEGETLSYQWSTDAGTLTPSSSGETAVFSSDDGPAVAHVRVRVSDGGLAATDTQAITVRNVAPTVDAGPDVSGFWGVPLAFSGRVGDPSAVDTRAGLAPSWSFGDGSAGVSGAVASHAYGSPGGYTAALSATDKDGATASDTALVTVAKRPASLAYTGPAGVAFGFATLTATLTDAVDPATADLAARVVTFVVDGQSLTATTDAHGVASVLLGTALGLGGHQVGLTFAGDDRYVASSSRAAVMVASSPGKVTAGLQLCAGGSGGFTVQSDGASTKGELQFKRDRLDFHAHELTALGIARDGRSAWLAGTTTGGQTLLAYAEDNGEPGGADVFKLWIAGVLQTGDGGLCGSNVQIHLDAPLP